ncbi:TspO/MBR family protein [Xanthomarina spongicola]|uniref:TspO/MBR related protein n=1 Tax=Xanthomarina spongicola TaxID=570520 RepID=A0A316DQ40_9FLAO|nr:TspO/MBR family protein [Xanthomarina spongicola]PWK19896.1 TspO/MBR related protein [Xanthomarina spongicola]
MKKYQLVILFLIINFAALGIGSWLMDNGPMTEWYMSLNQAPWTPPGWLFGVAWTTIMICFSFYMASLIKLVPNTFVVSLFAIQFVLNVSWNYIFFNQHLVGFGLIIILFLTIVVGTFLFKYMPALKTKTWLIVLYFGWLIIASSLNAYILFNN